MIAWIRIRAADGNVISPLVTSSGSFLVSDPACLENPDELFLTVRVFCDNDTQKNGCGSWRECSNRERRIDRWDTAK